MRGLFVLMGVLALSGCAKEESRQPAPDVLLVTLDTLRSDWIHAYGFEQYFQSPDSNVSYFDVHSIWPRGTNSITF